MKKIISALSLIAVSILSSANAFSDTQLQCVYRSDEDGDPVFTGIGYGPLSREASWCITDVFYGIERACYYGNIEESAKFLRSQEFAKQLQTRRYDKENSPLFGKEGFYSRVVDQVQTRQDVILFRAREMDIYMNLKEATVLLKQCEY